MTLWHSFIAWVDADIYKASPGLRGWALAMCILPLLIFALLDLILRPEDSLRLAIFIPACLFSAVLFGIWQWRVIVNIRG